MSRVGWEKRCKFLDKIKGLGFYENILIIHKVYIMKFPPDIV